jgi:glycosyltransferase involved in cell wall biosynthesis
MNDLDIHALSNPAAQAAYSSILSAAPASNQNSTAHLEMGSDEAVDLNTLLTFSDLTSVPDLVCFSHLRWDFVFQRPQHLLTRFASQTRVFYIEEPHFGTDHPTGYLDVQPRGEQIWILTPHFPHGRSAEENDRIQQELLKQFMQEQNIGDFIAWYYTPMALGYSAELKPVITVYDCMDELSAFAGAPPQLLERERELFRRADRVYTGGQSLYEAKRERHHSVHAFPSSIERKHFAQARQAMTDPADQAGIAHPRLGFFGVIDERMDIHLLGEVARMRPEWQIVLLGPVVKINPDILPRPANIHYLGMKSYQELPAYISNWDVALLPFALNESTRFISPTKTPEYLAAGKPTVSTPITDVIRPYGEKNLVHIAGTPEEFVKAIEAALQQKGDSEWLSRVDEYLSGISWDHTWAKMTHLICQKLQQGS